MKFAKKIEIKLTVKDNQFLKELVPYLQRCCIFSTDVENHNYYSEQTELVALIDSDEFIITLEPITNKFDKLAIVDGEFQYIVHLVFQGTTMSGHFYGSYEPYVLFTPSEVFELVFPNVDLITKELLYPSSPNIDINLILSMVFGLKNKEKFKYEII